MFGVFSAVITPRFDIMWNRNHFNGEKWLFTSIPIRYFFQYYFVFCMHDNHFHSPFRSHGNMISHQLIIYRMSLLLLLLSFFSALRFVHLLFAIFNHFIERNRNYYVNWESPRTKKPPPPPPRTNSEFRNIFIFIIHLPCYYWSFQLSQQINAACTSMINFINAVNGNGAGSVSVLFFFSFIFSSFELKLNYVT